MSTQATAVAIQDKIVRFESFVEADPRNPSLWFELGDLYHKVSRFDEALSSFEKCIYYAPDNLAAHSRKASVMISSQRYSEAENIFSALRENDSSNPALLYNNALSVYHQKRWDDALAIFTQALAVNADPALCLSHMSRCQHQLGNIADAISLCEQWVEINNSTDGRGYLSLLEMDNFNKERASKLANDVLKQAPDNTDAALVAGSYFVEDQEIDRANNLFDKVLQQRPDSARAIFGKGLTMLYEQNHKMAIGFLGTAVELMPTNTGARAALGWAQITTHEFIDAKKTFQDLIAIDRNFAEGHGGLAYVYAMQNKVDLANAEIKKATRLDPTSFGAGAARGAVLGSRGKMKRSVNFLADLLEKPLGPGEKPIIDHIKVYLTKREEKKLNVDEEPPNKH